MYISKELVLDLTGKDLQCENLVVLNAGSIVGDALKAWHTDKISEFRDYQEMDKNYEFFKKELEKLKVELPELPEYKNIDKKLKWFNLELKIINLILQLVLLM